LGIAVTFQAQAQYVYWQGVKSALRETPLKQRFFGDVIALTDCARYKLKGRSLPGEYVSDKGYETLTPSVFRYELYPVINLVSGGPAVEARVCFQSEQCHTVPPGFDPVCETADGYVAVGNGRE
jgi:hypothetical protein